jgi:hypothetical protein
MIPYPATFLLSVEEQIRTFTSSIKKCHIIEFFLFTCPNDFGDKLVLF